MKPLIGAIFMIGLSTVASAQDPLQSWNDTAPKKAIVVFVEKVTTEGSPNLFRLPNASPHSITTVRFG